jgi:poly(A) polymerase
VEQVQSLVANHMKFKDVPRMRESTLKRFLRMDCFEEHLELHRIDCLSSHGSLDAYNLAAKKLRDVPAHELRPVRLITGSDLIAQGYRPGPIFSKILQAVEDAQLEDRVSSREEAIAFVAQNFSPQASASDTT